MSDDIDVEGLRKWLEQGKAVTVLDVRPKDQRAEWAIPGSIHADVYEAVKSGNNQAVESLALPHDRPVVTVCGLGKTSKKAADILSAAGREAYSLIGGMKAWSLAWNLAEVSIQERGARILQVRRAGKGCLSYLIASGGDAVVIDPSVDPQVYMNLAAKRGVRIMAVLDTHVHADHFSRSRALAALAGAKAGPLLEGGELKIGGLILKALHTPGHTPESTCYWIEDQAVVTGDTLFLDSVGRPDLIAGLDPSQEAKRLYQSIQRLKGLSGETCVLPAHHPTPPAFDGVPIAATLADLRRRNKYLQAEEDDFISMIFSGQNAPPPNFEAIVEANKTGLFPEGDWPALEAGPNRCARA